MDGSLIQAKRKNSGADIAVLLLFASFMIFACVVTLLGITIYSGVSDRTSENYTARTALGYVTNQVRRAESIRIVPFGDKDALEITETAADTEYITLIYTYGGWLRELYVERGTVLEPDVGVELVEVSAFNIRVSGDSGGLFNISVSDKNGGAANVRLLARCPIAGGVK